MQRWNNGTGHGIGYCDRPRLLSLVVSFLRAVSVRYHRSQRLLSDYRTLARVLTMSNDQSPDTEEEQAIFVLATASELVLSAAACLQARICRDERLRSARLAVPLPSVTDDISFYKITSIYTDAGFRTAFRMIG